MIPCRSVILALGDLTEERWVPALAAARLNHLLLHAVRLPHDIDELIAFRASEAGAALRAVCAAAGIDLGTQMHTASWLLPRVRYWSRPELFRMDLQGRRVAQHNFCVSSDEAWELIEPRALALAAALPADDHRYFWFPDDVTRAACHCERCGRLSPSDQGLLFANRLLPMLRRVDGDARICYLAYHDTLDPPEQVEPADGVFLEFAPISRSFRHALADPECAANRRNLTALRALLPIFGPSFHVTEYWLDVSLHSGWQAPARRLAVDLDILRRDVATYAELGADSITTYAVWADADYWEAFGPPPIAEYGQILAG